MPAVLRWNHQSPAAAARIYLFGGRGLAAESSAAWWCGRCPTAGKRPELWFW
uniref:Uncharacterized protein n=1 Tax=Arundo donax TaxID=35708 RepID=A0A0A8XP61_ARUDO